MKIAVGKQDVFGGSFDAVVFFTFEEGQEGELLLQDRFGSSIALARSRKEFEGKLKQLYIERQTTMPRLIVLAGLGKKATATNDVLRLVAGAAAESLRIQGAKNIAYVLPSALDAPSSAQAIVEGAMLRTYQFTAYKTQLKDYKELSSITVVTDAEVKTAVETAVTIAESCNMVRDLQNTPSIDLTPPMLAEQAAKMAKAEKISCTVLDKAQLAKQGYNGILSVGKGSEYDPRLVTLEYAPKGYKKTIALVGKGITFDTGGISIKPGEKMSDMKFDMSGAAVVIGVLRNAARMKLPVRIIGVLCLAENMPDGNSYKPGDVVRTKLGKTIEIDNTDAEGRVVLADGLHHATTFKPDEIIDVATLTGACVVALGDVAAGVMGNNQQLIDRLTIASATTGEKIWQFPMWDEYAEDIKSSIADMKNVGLPRQAGTIAGAMLLKEFVGDIPWAHFDTAGTSWVSGRERYFTANGGTAFGVRLLTQYLRMQ